MLRRSPASPRPVRRTWRGPAVIVLGLSALLLIPASACAAINSPTNALGTVGLPFSYQISSTTSATNNISTNYSATNLPAGVLLTNTNTGLVTGLPQAAGAYTSTVFVTYASTNYSTNAGGSTVTNYTTNSNNVYITVNPPAAPALASPLTFFGMQGQPFNYPLLSVPSHSNVPTAFGVSGLPAGLVLTNTNTTNVSYPNVTVTNFSVVGSPTTNGSFQVTVSITNNLGAAAQVSTSQVVFVIAPPAAPVITSTNAVNATVGVPFSFDITAANSPDTFSVATTNAGVLGPSITNGVVANGLSISNIALGSYKVGRLAGVPATTNTINLQVVASNSVRAATNNLTINVAPPQPTVILSQPLGEANYVVGSSFFINAQAFDRLPDNIVPSSVGFTETIGIGPAAPIPGIVGRLGDFYGLEYYPAPAAPFPATFLIGATAQNSLGQPANSGILTMTAETPRSALPTIEMLPLLPGPQIQAGSTVTLRARAIAPGAPVQRVEFYVNKVFVDAVNAPVAGTNEYQLQWTTPLQPGAFEVNARVVSENIPAGALGPNTPPFFASVITRVPTIVNTIPGVSPSVVIATPANGAELRVGVPNRIVASASVASGSIAQVQFFQNGRAIGAPVNAEPFAADFVPTSYGSYELFAIATSDAGLATVSPPVTVTVADGAAPTVSLTAPTTAKTGEILTFTATADDTDGDVVSVEFRANGLPLPTPDAEGNVNPDLAAPYRYIFAPGAPGRYELVARATDNEGNVTDSAPTTLIVSVGTPPTVDFTIGGGSAVLSPDLTIARSGSNVVMTYVTRNGLDYVIEETADLSADDWQPSAVVPDDAPSQSGVAVGYTRKQITVTASGNKFFRVVYPASTFNVNETAFLQADATDVDGSIAQVQFLVNGVARAPLLVSPYRLDLPLPGPGRYDIIARATDNLGNVTDSAVQTIIVTSGAAPTVSISNPQNSDPVSQVTPGIPVAVTVNAADADGSVARVDLLVNGEVVGFSTQAPYIFTDAGQFSGGTNTTFTPTSEGLYVIVARATDNLGNVTDSEPVTVRAKSPTPVGLAPTVQITQPIGEIYYVTGSSLFLNARAADASPGTVDPDSVAFTVNGLPIPGATVGQVGDEYGVRYTATEPFTTDTIRAQATDDDGNTTYSQPNYTVLTLAQAPLPQVQMLELLPGQPQDAGGEVTLRAEAIFPPTASQQARVEFYANNVYVGTGTQDTTNPRLYTLAWETPEDNGSYTVEARAVALNFQTNTGNDNVIEYFGSVISGNSIAVNTIPGNAPTVAITSPLAGQTINANQPFTVRATASVPGNVSIVPPSQAVGLAVTSVPVAVGDSVAVDDPLYYVSFFGTPAPVKSTVAGEVTEINIKTGDLITAGLVTMTIKDPTAGGTIDRVEFYANGALIGADEIAPYEATFTPESVGLYNLAALAYSDSGLVGTSEIVPVSSVLGTPPVVTLTAPAKAVIGQAARLVATPSILEAGRDIRQVEFLVNNLVVATLTEANDGSSYVYDWPVTAPGIYQVQTRATDNVGNVALSEVLELPSRVAPAVLLQAPNSAVIGQVIAMSAAVTNPTGGVIASVEFLVNGNVIASDSTAPYSTTYTVPGAGAYELRARAVDVEDVAGLSNIITLDVPAPPPPDPTAPTVSIVSPTVGSSVLVGTPVELTAVASPGDGATITSVVFSIEDPDRGIISRVATQSGAAYVASFTPALEGLYNITATVTNTRGQTATALVGVLAQTTPPVPPGTNEAFVQEMYQKILGRVPTGLELSSGTADLDNGLSKAGFVLSLLEGDEYADVQNRVADFYFTAGVTPTTSAFGTCVADVRADTAPMTGFDDYLATFAWSPERPPFGATLGQVTAAQRVYSASGSISRNIADNASYVRWLFERLGGEVGSLQEVVARMATYGNNARGAALSLLTANFENIGSVDVSMAAAQQGYQYQLRATTVRFLLGGAWQPSTVPSNTISPVTRLANLEISTRDSLLAYIERLLADTAVVLVTPGSATLAATASPGVAGVTSVTAVIGGTGYRTAAPPQVVLAAPQSATARASATVVNGSVASISLSNVFNGYYFAPPLVIVGQPSSLFSPVAAGAVALLGSGATEGRVTNLQVTIAGSGYGSAPWVKVAPPDSVQAAVGSVGISVGGQITNLTLAEPGTGYTTNSPGVLVGAPPEIMTATNAPVSLSAKSLTNSPLVTISTFQLLLNGRPVATNSAIGNAMTGNFSFIAPVNTGTNNLSVRSVNAQGMVLSESAWTKLIVTP